MVCDFLFPAAWSFLLFVQVSHRDKQQPGDSKKSQTTFNDDSSAQATQRSQRRGRRKRRRVGLQWDPGRFTVRVRLG